MREGNLFVADNFNHRILRFDDAANKTNGSDADSVIGHETVSSRATGLSDRELDSADFDPVTNQDNSLGAGAGLDGRIWVADSGNHRVLAFTKDSHFPDLRISLNSSATRGSNVHNAGGAGQTQSYTIRNGKKARLFARLENDGNVDETCSLKGLGSNSRFKITVFLVTGRRRNVTSSVKSGLHQTGLQVPGSNLLYQHEIRPKRKEKSRRGTVCAWLQATLTTDAQGDRVVPLVKNRPK